MHITLIKNTEGDGYLLAAVRYIHNNPLKAGIVSRPSDYKWSSYELYINAVSKESCPVNVEFILSIFSKERNKAEELFKAYSRQENNDRFIEYKSDKQTEKPMLSEREAGVVVLDYLRENSLCLNDLKKSMNTKLRRDLIVQLKSTSLSVRQIANILDIDRNIVQRTI